MSEEEALQAYRFAAEHFKTPGAYYRLGSALFSLGDKAKALSYFKLAADVEDKVTSSSCSDWVFD